MIRVRAATAAVSVAAVLAAACGSDAPSAATGLEGELVVFAAASLTDVVDELGADLVAAHPDLTVIPNLAGSQALATQLEEGAAADVFLAADEAQAERVVAAGLAAEAAPLVANELAIVVEAGNPLGIADLEDLARDDVLLVLAGEEVPAGRYAAELLDAADLEVAPVSREVDVRAVLGKVRLGEADAGIVYRTDALAAGDAVELVELPADRNVVATTYLVVLDDAPNPGAAAAFVQLLRSDTGRERFEAAGFRVLP